MGKTRCSKNNNLFSSHLSSCYWSASIDRLGCLSNSHIQFYSIEL